MSSASAKGAPKLDKNDRFEIDLRDVLWDGRVFDSLSDQTLQFY
jgi:hypothetical protein